MSKKIKITDLKPDDKNFNKHSDYGMSLLDKSVDKIGVIESITVSADDVVISGNARREVMSRKFGNAEPVIVETDGKRPVILKRTDIKANTKKFHEAALLANTVAEQNINLDKDLIQEFAVEEYGIDVEELGVADVGTDKEDEKIKHVWIPDCLFASNNEYDIPTLLKPEEPFYVEMPFKAWGAEKRGKQGVGTYHFYVDDYRFDAVWNNPELIIQSGCRSIVEPNTSVYETTPVSYGIFLIYKKRWLARFLQDYGINVFVDLNVTEKFMPHNLMGIPEGYNAFFTRGYENRIAALTNELNIAKNISGQDNPNMVVYGGSKKVKDFCNKHNLTYINNTSLDIKMAKI